MVAVCNRAATLVREEIRSNDEIEVANLASTAPTETEPETETETAPASTSPPLATTQAAGDALPGVTAQRVAGTTKAILERGLVSALRDRSDQRRLQGDAGFEPQQMTATSNCSRTSPPRRKASPPPTSERAGARGWLAESFPGSTSRSRASKRRRTMGSRRRRRPQGRARLSGSFCDRARRCRRRRRFAWRSDSGTERDRRRPATPRDLVPLARRQLAGSASRCSRRWSCSGCSGS